MAADFAKAENNPFSHIRDNHDENVAFVIHRNKNKNVVVYAANFEESGKLHPSDPLKVYWVMFEQEGNPTEGLNIISETFMAFEIWIVVAAIYLVITVTLSVLIGFLETHMRRSSTA